MVNVETQGYPFGTLLILFLYFVFYTLGKRAFPNHIIMLIPVIHIIMLIWVIQIILWILR